MELEPALDIMASVNLKAALIEAISASKNVVLDGSKVERATTPCVQLLIAAARSAKAEDGTFKIENPSDVLVAVFEELGLSSELKEWSV